MSISRFNNEVVKYEFEPSKDFEFKTLEELFKDGADKKVHTVKGMVINTKSKFGDSPIVVGEESFINLPNHLLDVVKEIRQDKEITDKINNNKIGFTIYSYVQEKFNRTCYSINWVEIE